MTDTRNDFSQGSIPKTIIRLSVPLIGAQIINALYSIVDRIYIGRISGVGSLALTGVGITFPFIMAISAFAVLAGMGGAPLASIARGEGDNRQAERIMGNSFVLLLGFGVALTILCLTIKGKALYWFGASDDTFSYANEYLTIYAVGSLSVMICVGMNSFISIQGFTRVSMMTVLIGAVLNIVLDPLFIFVFKMGVQGAALATILAQGVSALWILRFLRGSQCVLRLRLSAMRPDGKMMRRICWLGFSSFVMNVTDSLVSIVCNNSLQRYGGDVYVGVMTVVSSVRQVLSMPLSGFSQSALPVISFNYGAKRYDRVRQASKFTLYVCLGFSGFMNIVVLLFPEALIRLFNNEPALIAAGIPSIRTYFSLFFFMGFQMMAQRCYVALGRAKQATFFSLLRKAIIVAPLAYLLPGMFNLGVRGVFLAEPISDFLGPAACFSTFMLVEWPKLKMPPTLE